jgi:hypothetical protein
LSRQPVAPAPIAGPGRRVRGPERRPRSGACRPARPRDRWIAASTDRLTHPLRAVHGGRLSHEGRKLPQITQVALWPHALPEGNILKRRHFCYIATTGTVKGVANIETVVAHPSRGIQCYPSLGCVLNPEEDEAAMRVPDTPATAEGALRPSPSSQPAHTAPSGAPEAGSTRRAGPAAGAAHPFPGTPPGQR